MSGIIDNLSVIDISNIRKIIADLEANRPKQSGLLQNSGLSPSFNSAAYNANRLVHLGVNDNKDRKKRLTSELAVIKLS
jgi:hypothetical protein